MEEEKNEKRPVRKRSASAITKSHNSRIKKETNIEKKDRKRAKSRLEKDTKDKLIKNSNLDIEFSNIETGLVAINNEVSKPVEVKSKEKKLSIFEKPKLKIIPLGGLNEIGKNLTVFEYDNEIIVVDCGLAFPEDEMLGVDLVIPDITYLEKNKSKVKALVITHGHEDHIGAIPYFLKKINVPVYGTKLTLGIIKNKLVEHNMERTVTLKCVKPRDVVKFSKFKVEFIKMTHSIADSVALAITTPVGVVFHTGDFKVDYTPIDGEPMDFHRIAELGQKGILLLLSDSRI